MEKHVTVTDREDKVERVEIKSVERPIQYFLILLNRHFKVEVEVKGLVRLPSLTQWCPGEGTGLI